MTCIVCYYNSTHKILHIELARSMKQARECLVGALQTQFRECSCREGLAENDQAYGCHHCKQHYASFFCHCDGSNAKTEVSLENTTRDREARWECTGSSDLLINLEHMRMRAQVDWWEELVLRTK